jgi:hypothetical protein
MIPDEIGVDFLAVGPCGHLVSAAISIQSKAEGFVLAATLLAIAGLHQERSTISSTAFLRRQSSASHQSAMDETVYPNW